ncbi:MAG: agmatinase [Candidatus Methanofastidiosa archaeon]|nr:agmatinase [Candidatus Methanofastidiosa archaeon]
MSEDLYFYTYRKCYFPLDTTRIDEAEYLLLGVPFDSTQTGMTGARYGPSSIRMASFDLEHYDPEEDLDLSEIRLHDIGDVDCVPGSPVETFNRIRHTMENIPPQKKLISLGGEHSISLPIIDMLRPQMVISFDAHPDLRNDYMGVGLSHSSVMRRVNERGIPLEIIGAREGSKEEFDYAKGNGIGVVPPQLIDDYKGPSDKDIYISIDLDVFDRLEVGNPVPGGIDFNTFCKITKELIRKNSIRGFDIVELSSQPNEYSSYFAAKLLFKMISYLESYKD